MLSYHLQIMILWLLPFQFLVALARTSSTILHRYEESRNPFLVPELDKIALSFSPFNLMLAYCILPSLCLGFSLVSLIIKSFIIKGWIFVKDL